MGVENISKILFGLIGNCSFICFMALIITVSLSIIDFSNSLVVNLQLGLNLMYSVFSVFKFCSHFLKYELNSIKFSQKFCFSLDCYQLKKIISGINLRF